MPYIVVEKKKDNVLLQKSAPNGLLSSRQYWVPCNKVFPMIPFKDIKQKEVTGPPLIHSDSSESDLDCSVDLNHSVPFGNNSECSSSYSPVQERPANRPAVDQLGRRSSRTRSKPQRYGIDQDNSDGSVNSDNDDLIPSWYPGWDKARTHDYISKNN